MRLLAIDFGLKRTGLAICDPDEKIASPLAAIEGQTPALIRKILDYMENWDVGGIVIGLPLNMDGSEGTQAGTVRRFAGQLRKHIDIPLHFYDERLTSFEAEKKLGPMELTSRKRKKRLDAVAAANILQDFLDSKQTG